MKQLQITEQVTDALFSLGETPDEIAGTLKQVGSIGVREDAKTCPIAVFLNSRLKRTVEVHEQDLTVDGHVVDLPKPHRQFVEEFDAGYHEELHIGRHD